MLATSRDTTHAGEGDIFTEVEVELFSRLADMFVRKFGSILVGYVVEIRRVLIQQTRTTLVYCVLANTSVRNTRVRYLTIHPPGFKLVCNVFTRSKLLDRYVLVDCTIYAAVM
jgi:hypothetical protein